MTSRPPELCSFRPIQAAFLVLRSAFDAAALSGRAEWALGLPRSLLESLGVSPAQIDWLREAGWLGEAPGGFVLTADGAERVRDTSAATSQPADGGPGIRLAWEEGSWLLGLGGVVVKRFAATADTQVEVLQAFHRAGWPPRLRLLPEDADAAAKVRLRETVRRLNYSQQPRLLKFYYRRGAVGWGLLKRS